jgi:hypothetical protein
MVGVLVSDRNRTALAQKVNPTDAVGGAFMRHLPEICVPLSNPTDAVSDAFMRHLPEICVPLSNPTDAVGGAFMRHLGDLRPPKQSHRRSRWCFQATTYWTPDSHCGIPPT